MANEDVQKTLAELSRQLQESKARLEEAQRVAHVGHWEWDLATDAIAWSDETYRIFGLSPQERPMDLATVRSMVHPEDREPLYQAVDLDLVAGQRPSGEFRIVRPSGEVRTVSSLTSERWSSLPGDAKRDASGRPYKLFGTIQDITERKRSEEAFQEISRKLQESNAKLEEAQRIANVGHYSWNLIENRVIWSDEVYRIYGLDPLQGTIDLVKVSEMIHPEDRELVFRAAEEALRSGTPADIEHRLVRPDGEVRTIHSVGTVKRDASGHPYEMFGTAQDITDRKRSEQALKRNEFYLSEGQRIAHIGSWAFSDSGHYWSDELYKIYGLDPQNGAPTVEQYLNLIHPQDRASMAETIRRMQEEQCGFDQIERIIRPDGQLRYIRAVAVPLVEQGIFKGFIGTTMDVTEQELLTQELRRDQAYLAEAQSLTHIGSWATNFHTQQMFHLSDETFRLHGFDPQDAPIPLERFFDTIHPEDRPAVTAVLERAIQTRTDYDVREFRVCLPDGSIRFLRTIGHHNPAAEMGYYIGITMDITERKQAEQEREKLRQLEADLAHINRVNMMGELAAALAHEIRQPIAASITSASACLRWLARDPPDLERARAAAARIEQDGNRAAEVINRLRSFYKKGAPPEPVLVDLKEVIWEMTALLRKEAVRHSIRIHSEPNESVPSVLADRVQVQQVFMNLMLNAIEAMRDTGGKLTISSRLTPEGQVTVSIGDTGIGLSAENTERTFDAFHTTKPQGTGMGLAITRSIVEAHGGRVWATVNQDTGATFHFTLPTGREADT
jgi:PAS domain S-box-containing protein